MARTPRITRTITTTKATVLCLNIVTKEPLTEVITLPRTHKDEQTMLKLIKPLLESDTIKVVHIVSAEVCEALYGMSEQDFIKNAYIISNNTDETDKAE